MSLTDATVRALKAPPKGQKYYPDDKLAGFYCRVSQGGTKTFLVVHGVDRRHITIGRYPTITLSDARSEAKKRLAEMTLGRGRPSSVDFLDAKVAFLEDKRQSRRRSTVKGYQRLLGLFRFKGKLADITHEHAARRLGLIKAPSERGHALVAGKVFFNWCIKRRYRPDNPLTGLSKPTSKPRKRVLTDDEIRAIWATEGEFADYVKLLLLTGQRRSELRQAIVGTDTLTIPEEVSKNHRASIIPFMPLARSYWRTFTFGDWGWQKAALDKATGTSGWQLHDCRRTFRTGLASLRVPPHVAERLLNHITGQSPLERIYDQHPYLEEMKEAMAGRPHL